MPHATSFRDVRITLARGSAGFGPALAQQRPQDAGLIEKPEHMVRVVVMDKLVTILIPSGSSDSAYSGGSVKCAEDEPPGLTEYIAA